MLDGVVGMHNDRDSQSHKLSPHRCVTAGDGSRCTHCRSVVGEKNTLACMYFFKLIRIVLGGTNARMQRWCTPLKSCVIVPKSLHKKRLTAWRLLL